jgi:hypothetical protein
VPAPTDSEPSSRAAAWHALFDRLLTEREEIAREIRGQMQERLPVYREIGAEILESDIRLSLLCTLESARAGSGAESPGEVAALVEVGRSQAEAGVPLQDLLRAWRFGIEETIRRARSFATDVRADASQVLEFITAVLAWSDAAMVETARGHRLAELERARSDHERRAAFVRGLLAGTALPSDIRVQADLYGIDSSRSYLAVRARPLASCSVRELERALGFDQAASLGHGLSALMGDDLVGFLRTRPRSAKQGVVGIGPPRPLEQLAESARLATRAFVTADRFELTGIQDLESLGLRAAVAADWDMGDALGRQYVEPLAETGATLDLLNTVRTYIACGMHIERTAQRLVIHRNTLRYRISRFEALTNSNLRDPATAFGVWWALERADMRTDKPAGDAQRPPDDPQINGPSS